MVPLNFCICNGILKFVSRIVWFQEISIHSPHGRFLEILKGSGGGGVFEAKLEFPAGSGGLKPKILCGDQNMSEYFLEEPGDTYMTMYGLANYFRLLASKKGIKSSCMQSY